MIHETPAAVVQDRSGWDVTGAHEAMVRAARAREIIEPRAELFVDASGAYTRKQAVRLRRLAADLDVHWFEKPVSSDDVVGLQISGHCAPHPHVHIATANVRHLEWSHDHVGIESMFFDGTLDPTGGSISPRDAPGNRLELRAADADTYRVGGVPGRRRAFRDVAHDRECPGCGKPLLPAMSNPWGLVSRLHVDLRRHASAFCRP